MKVRDICQVIEDFAPPALAYEWDRIGLSIGDPDADVAQGGGRNPAVAQGGGRNPAVVLVALTVTPRAVQRAIRAHAGMIVSHHPLIWEPLRNLRADNPEAKLCLDIAAAGIACFAAHTNLDIAPGGVNDILADKLGLLNQTPLIAVPQGGQVKLITFVPELHLAAVRDAVCEAGAGVIGDYSHCTFSGPGAGTFLPGADANPFSGTKNRVNEEPERRFETFVPTARIGGVIEALKRAHPYEEVAYDLVPLENRDTSIGIGVRGEIAAPVTLDAFATTVRKNLKLAHVRVTGEPKRRVRTVAVLGGAGGGQVRDVPAGIDVFVTGDIGYHDALAAQPRGLALIDAGHAGTEKCVLPLLAKLLKQHSRKLRVTIYNETEVFRVCVEKPR